MRLARSFRRLLGTAASNQVVSMVRSDGIAQVTLKRPDKLNALNMPMFRAIQAAARELIEDKDVRAVVLHGEGRAFCAGLDLKSVMHPLEASENMKELLLRPEGEISNLAQDVGYLWRRVPVPVIAVTQGVCFGGGMQIALGADMRVTSPTCRFSIMEAKWGLIPDMGASVVLPELIPKDVALELTMTGRIFEATEALKLGLVTKVADEPLAEALHIAREIASRSPDATAAAKRLLHATYSSNDEARALHLESELQRKLIGGWNQMVSTTKGFGVPSLLQPRYAQRSEVWNNEADEQAEQELRAMLDGQMVTRAASKGDTL
mmetsp:Transcript_36309/g.60139  ORF Transcript_36309/g.60139 Transcript_36309/m.60139 type:complete len:321 (+) Transcript_36309:23-985(+)